MSKKPRIAIGTFTITELYVGRTVESDFAFLEPADDLVLLTNSDRLPSKIEVLRALQVIQRANGADLDEWTAGVLPCDDIQEALTAIRDQGLKSDQVNGGAFRQISIEEWRSLGGDENPLCDWHEGAGYVIYDDIAKEQYRAKIAALSTPTSQP
ncbi:hypothetical protein RMR10_004455 [Agrobacterium rosae]|uniref:hypothetical protein n=1 Tax=Agrobacterium rosae TaxID=1972867 RepID=UPI002A150577|nr:hypothetical protein [Agrobacterium rosae]MDX8315627.1 hypothetical protein [Agrobacterium rosae]